MSFTIFQSEKTPLQAIKTRSLKSRKIDIFPKGLTHRFGPKIASFSTFFLSNRGQENVFYDILERKKAFLGYKNKKFKKSKNRHFQPRGLTHGFGANTRFSTFFFQLIYFRKISFTIFQAEKTSFQDIKKRSLKSRKIDMFSKGLTHGFGPKMASFPTFFFRQYISGKCLLRYSTARKRLSRP